ncbi:hypothetical protein PVT71_08885 [Salipiger sp. H15]|uniref:Uncharacterized protein n=1 Tax=Alloyangia sp. H15 TaxID=3029062 RepID=A0AAU8ADN5_9RHOB
MAFPAPSRPVPFSGLIAGLVTGLASSLPHPAPGWLRWTTRADLSREEDRARRDFIQEMLARSPDAFSGAQDVQSFMQHFPDRF